MTERPQPTENGTICWNATLPSLALTSIARELVLADGERPEVHRPRTLLRAARGRRGVAALHDRTALTELPGEVGLEHAGLTGDDHRLAAGECLTRIRAVHPDRGHLGEQAVVRRPLEDVGADRLEDRAAAGHGDRDGRARLLDGGRHGPDEGLDGDPLRLLGQPGDAGAAQRDADLGSGEVHVARGRARRPGGHEPVRVGRGHGDSGGEGGVGLLRRRRSHGEPSRDEHPDQGVVAVGGSRGRDVVDRQSDRHGERGCVGRRRRARARRGRRGRRAGKGTDRDGCGRRRRDGRREPTRGAGRPRRRRPARPRRRPPRSAGATSGAGPRWRRPPPGCRRAGRRAGSPRPRGSGPPAAGPRSPRRL